MNKVQTNIDSKFGWY